ncbi:MAG TPA: hypothetical protein VGN93_31200 [Shinella sp.]|uniref:hypothetical protein n=1 Tax=Shinella sp. TaxID=1870904 RepID=UPI002E13F616|nr:hypothetical protein [Shinella sp.]
MNLAATTSHAPPVLGRVPEWTVMITDQGEPQSAFLRGHQNLSGLVDEAEAEIIAAFASFSTQLASVVMETIDQAGGAAVRHDWMRMTSGDVTGDFFEFCQQTATGAFPVTAVRFR